MNLSVGIGLPVEIYLSRSKQKDPEKYLQEDCQDLASENNLVAEFEIPNAASRMIFVVDFLRRNITISMKISAPKDKSRAVASINWLTRQLRGKGISNTALRVYWPKRIPMTSGTLELATENPSALVPDGCKELPSTIEVVRIIDLATRFKGAKTFVEDVNRVFPAFYGEVGQHLNQWVAKAPKVKAKKRRAINTYFNVRT